MIQSIPILGQTVLFNNKLYKVIKCNMAGKCTIKKLLLPFKGSVLKNIDITELKEVN